jgi:hypothetical protein
MISEEFVNDREDLSVSRKKDLRYNLMLKAPQIVKFINEYLQYLQTGVDQNSAPARSAAIKLLETATTYFSWITLDKNTGIDWGIIFTIFKYASRKSVADQSMSVPAINCLNEIMQKSFVPKDAETMILNLYNMMLQILNQTVENQFTSNGMASSFQDE